MSEGIMKITTIIAFVLAIIGAIVWGLVGIFDYNVVAAIFGAGAGAIISRVIYTLVGVAGLWLILYWAIYKPFKQID